MRQRDILTFWLPLFASWLLMTAEGPVVSAAINRLPNEVVMLAAQGIVVSLAVTIESPIMNLLATATALVRDRHSYLLVRKFTIHWSIALTLVAAALALTPLFDLVVVRWMGTPPEISRWVRPGLQIMILWTAAIAWRRFLQGVLIRFGRTRSVGWATVVRLLASGSTALGLALWSVLPGVIIGALALMAGVVAEALAATWAVRPLLRNQLAEERPPANGSPLTYRKLFWFHLPLASTALLTLLTQPLVTMSLARLDNPNISLAAWPLVFQIILMARAAALALPEVVIALTDNENENEFAVRRFSLLLTATTVVGMVLLVFTPLLSFYLLGVQDTEANVALLANYGTRLFLLYPALFVILCYLRGTLISHHRTAPINIGMGINLVVTAVILAAGVVTRRPGIETAAIALNTAVVVELLFLWWRMKHGQALQTEPDTRPPRSLLPVSIFRRDASKPPY